MNIFSALRIYAGSWNESGVRPFDPAEVAAVVSAKVVESQYGLSVCFIMVSGGKTFIPVDQNCSAAVGQSVDLTKAQLVTLSKQGEEDIFRVRF